MYFLMCAISETNPLQWGATFCPESEIHFRLQPPQYLSRRSSDGEVAVLVWAAETPPLSLYPPKHPHNRPPNPNWFGFRNKSDSRFAFEWGPGARIYIIGVDYVGADINRGSQRCHRDEGYFVLTDFFLLQFVQMGTRHICNCGMPQGRVDVQHENWGCEKAECQT